MTNITKKASRVLRHSKYMGAIITPRRELFQHSYGPTWSIARNPCVNMDKGLKKSSRLDGFVLSGIPLMHLGAATIILQVVEDSV